MVLLDNGRSKLLGSEFRDMLRCIRCGACMNNCPVYGSIGGHAYGWVYVGPMGAVLTPSLIGVENARHLPQASSFCGRCEEVCPMGIPLPRMMRTYREQAFTRRLSPARERWATRAWAALARRPRLYRLVGEMAARMLGKRRPRAGARSAACPAGRRMAGRTRPAGAAGPHLPRPVAGARAREPRARSGAMNPSSRERILGAVRASLPARDEAALRRVSDHDANLVPARAAASPDSTSKRCSRRWRKRWKCTLARVADEAEVPEAVAAFLARHNLPTEIAMAPDPRLDRIPLVGGAAAPRAPWRRARQRSRGGHRDRRGDRGDRDADDGLRPRAGPTTLNFLPDNHIVVVAADDIVATYEDAWRRLEADGAELPRTVALITGPSRTSDIELVPTLGAHGPRRLHIVIAGAASAAAG